MALLKEKRHDVNGALLVLPMMFDGTFDGYI